MTAPELKLAWSAPAPACKEISYDHVIAETPFGRILITWKSWKDFPAPTVDEHPIENLLGCAFNDVETAQLAAERAYFEALAAGIPLMELGEAYKLADALYAAGYQDHQKENDYDPRKGPEWQAVVDALLPDTVKQK